MTVRNASHRYNGHSHSFCSSADGFIIPYCVWCKRPLRSDDRQLVRHGYETIFLPYCSPKCLFEDPEKGEYEKIVERFNSSGGKEEYLRKKAIDDQQWEGKQAIRAENEKLEKALKEKQFMERQAAAAAQHLRERKRNLIWQVMKAIFYFGLAAYIFYAC